MLILYTVAPLLYRMASSAYFNLSLLSSDFYGLLFGECRAMSLHAALTFICQGLFLYVRLPRNQMYTSPSYLTFITYYSTTARTGSTLSPS